MYYTYAYLREDGTPYYIGKGSKSRYKRPHNNVVVPPENRIVFLKKNLTEEEAYRHEIYMIDIFGRKDIGTGILHNHTNGGGPASGWVMNDAQKQMVSERFKGVPKGKSHMKMMEMARKSSDYCYGEEVQSKKSATNIKRGIKPPVRTGAKWYNNGVKSTLCHTPPAGWRLGRL